MSEKTFKIVGNDISDGYHTFDELYDHRMALYIALINNTDFPAFIQFDHYEGWDAVYLEMPKGQVSYHLPKSLRSCYLDRCTTVGSEKYDGHTSSDVLNRLAPAKARDE